MTGQTDDALALMKRAVVSPAPLELALAGFLSASRFLFRVVLLVQCHRLPLP